MMKVLIAEDDPIATRVLERLLLSWGYEPIVKTSGSEAWEYIVSHSDVHLALLDWMIPDLEGVEICKKLRVELLDRNVYAILVTGKTDRTSLIEGISCGADDYITKPFDKSELQVRLRAGERIVRSREELCAVNQHLEMVVRKRTEELEHALQVAQKASAMKSMFLANMSHEIRTPLNGIVSYADLLLLGDLDEMQREDVLTIRNCVQSLRTIINDILDFSKIEAGKMVIDLSPFTLRNAVREVVDILKPRIQEAELEFTLEITHSLPTEIRTDRVRVQQIITNLLANAIKFTPKNGAVTLRILDDTLGDRRAVRIEVQDSGIGIAAHKQEAIFASFEQADNTMTRRYGGTGLGLAICKKLCDLLEGEILLESEEGKGALFVALLPFEEETGEVVGVNRDAPRDAGYEATLQKRRILLAEDNSVNLKAMKRLLEASGCSVTGVEDGISAWRTAVERDFDLILMDIQMPGMDGVEATQKIRHSGGACSTIPIVALTANALDSDKGQYLAAGMNGVVSKPVEYRELCRVVAEMTKR